MDKEGEDLERDEPFYERPFEEVEDGYVDDRGFYTTPNGSFWDEDHNYFNHLGFDVNGGMYDKYGIYIPGSKNDDDNILDEDQNDFYNPEKFDAKKNMDISISKLRDQEKLDQKIIQKFGNLEEESDISSDEENDNSFDEDDFEEAYKDVLEQEIELKEILNPEIYTGIVERDFHLYIFKPKIQPEYVHIEENLKPICTCKMHNKDVNPNSGEKCIHIFFVLNEILHLNSDKENLVFKANELRKAFKLAECNNPNIIRETYGIAKRKNFDFPAPKIYKYEISQIDSNNEEKLEEWKIKERLYARGIIADEFIFPGISYALIEKTYDNYFRSKKEAKPTKKVYEKPNLTGRQLELDEIYNK